MSKIRLLNNVLFAIICMSVSQGYAQKNDMFLQDTTITGQATFTSFNSIVAGPNFQIAESGHAIFNTRKSIYFRPEIMVIRGGTLQTINDLTIIDDIGSVPSAIPDKFMVQQNYPNPFNPTTEIRYVLTTAEEVTIVIYDALGQVVRNLLSQKQQPGNHSVIWNARSNNGSQVSSGTYYYKVKAGNLIAFKKMILLR